MGPTSNDGAGQWGMLWSPGVQPPSVDVLLHADLAELVRCRKLQPFLHAHAESLTGGDEAATVLIPQPHRADGKLDTASFGILQLQAATNIAQPLAQRVQAQALAVEAASSGDATDGGRVSRRLAKLLLSDGLHAMVALECTRCAVLDGVCFGAKVKLSGTVQVRCGVLMLHPANILVLGGAVRALQAHWDATLQRLAKALEGSPGELHEEQPTGVPIDAAVGRDPAPHNGTSMRRTEEGRAADDDALALMEAAPAASSRAQGPVSASFTAPPPESAPRVNAAPPMALVVDAVLAEVRGNLSVLPEGSYSLPVQLHILQVVDGDPRAVLGGHLDVDLGHPWMRYLMGMGCEEFTRLSELAASGTHPDAEQQLQDVVERVSLFLERYGEGRFALEHKGRFVSCANGNDGVQWVVVGEQQRGQPS